MTKYRFKPVLLLFVLAASMLFMGQTTVKWKPMMFDNPGSKRALKTGKTSTFYYRSLPEKGMLLNVKDIQAIEIRAIAKSKVDKPVFIIKYNDKTTTYNLKFFSASVNYQIFEPVRISLVPGVKQIELISYNRNIYYRAYHPITIQKKKTHVPPLKIVKQAGVVALSSTAGNKQYYTVKQDAPLIFKIDKNKPFSLYMRAELKEKKSPELGIYRDGELINKVVLSTKRTKSYTAVGINHLTIGKKIDYPALNKAAVYEVRAITDNLFIARPVIRKVK